jgi:hypothetical protein
MVLGQIHGGIAQGLGLALMEEYRAGRTENLHDYLIPTIGDIPPIETILIEDREPLGPGGAKGVGEPALIPTPPRLPPLRFTIFGAVFRFFPTPKPTFAVISFFFFLFLNRDLTPLRPSLTLLSTSFFICVSMGFSCPRIMAERTLSADFASR